MKMDSNTDTLCTCGNGVAALYPSAVRCAQGAFNCYQFLLMKRECTKQRINTMFMHVMSLQVPVFLLQSFHSK